MCLELIYENSINRGLVEFAYLAIGDKIIVNRSEECIGDDGEPYVETHGGSFNSHLLLKFDTEDSTIMTALLNFEDTTIEVDVDDYEKWHNTWLTTLAGSLTNLNNNNFHHELYDNVSTMFIDAIYNAGFFNTFIEEEINNAFEKTDCWYFRAVDFQMHEPSKDDIHPQFDT